MVWMQSLEMSASADGNPKAAGPPSVQEPSLRTHMTKNRMFGGRRSFKLCHGMP